MTTTKPALSPEEQALARWEASAARQNERLAAKAPLFAHAGLVPTATAEEQRRKVEAAQADQEKRRAELAAKHTAVGEAYRAWVAERVTAEELVELERRRAWCPPTPEYDADFWSGKLRKLDPVRWRAMQDPAWIATMDAVAALEAARPVPAPPVEQLALPTGLRVHDAETGLRIGPVEARIAVVDVDESEAEREGLAGEEGAEVQPARRATG